jgi:hypothetical protein
MKMMPLPEAVAIQFVSQHMEAGAFKPTTAHQTAAGVMLDELLRWSGALQSLRAPR